MKSVESLVQTYRMTADVILVLRSREVQNPVVKTATVRHEEVLSDIARVLTRRKKVKVLRLLEEEARLQEYRDLGMVPPGRKASYNVEARLVVVRSNLDKLLA